MPLVYPYTQYSGIWTMQQVDSAIAAGTWPSQPGPSLYAWGYNPYGNLGLGNISNYSSPKQVGALKNWLRVATAYYTTLAVKTDGTLWSCGYNYYGQLGLGSTTYYSSPKQVGALTNWSKVFVANFFAAAIKTDGTLWTWGRNSDAGQLGLGNLTNYSSPKQVGALTNWSSATCLTNSVIAVKTDGTLWAWGSNNVGRLGLGNTTYYSSPKQVGALTNWSMVQGMANATMALKTDGTLWSWGYNAYGQLGQGTINTYSSPVQIGALTTWATINSTNATLSGAAIKTNGTLWTWGYNAYGQLGLGNITNYSSPKQVGALTTWSQVSLAFGVLARDTSNQLWSWGYNAYGQLGRSSTTDYSSPKQVGTLTTWSTVSAGLYSSFGIATT